MDILNDNSKVWENLPADIRQSIQMYLTARQFKNAILAKEKVIIPTTNPTSDAFIELFDSQLGGNITVRGDKYFNRMIPYIVNVAFACEVYLKLIIREQGVDISKWKAKDKHDIYKLYKCTNLGDECVKYLIKYKHDISMSYIEEEVEKISNAFIDWRYIYEHFEESMTIFTGFINVYCEFLDNYCASLLLIKYSYDVTKDVR
jgi:hypothetical protein